MKRLFALLLCLVMALSLIPAAAAEDIEIVDIEPEDGLIDIVDPEEPAEPTGEEEEPDIASGKCGSNVNWRLDGYFRLIISGSGAMYDYENGTSPWYDYRYDIRQISIDEGVTHVGNYAFAFLSNASKVSFPKTLRSIGEWAFDESGLASLSFPDSLTSIGTGSFAYCNGLKKVTIPPALETVGIWAFWCCHSLQSITVADGNPKYASRNGVLFNKDMDFLIQFPAAKTGSYTVPAGVITIGNGAFVSCSLDSVTVPEGVCDIHANAFARSNSLSDILLPASLNDISLDAFSNCDALRDVYFTGSRAQWDSINVESGNDPLFAATLHLIKKPTISSSPSSVTAVKGKTVKFTVSASGGELRYQWYYRENASEDWKACSTTGAKTATLSVEAKAYRSGYKYCCKVSNRAGSVYSKSATLTVTSGEKPTITTQPKSVSVSAGSTAKFTVKASNATGYQWYYRTSSSGSWAKSTLTGNKTATLSVAAETKRNGYQYRCKVSNSNGYVYSSAATLTVIIEKPTITTNPLDYIAGGEPTITFRVKATGAESYQWYYRSSSSGSWEKSSLSGSKTSALKVKATEARDGYQYCCKVTNAAGSTWSKAAKLTVVSSTEGDLATWKLSSSGLMTLISIGSDYYNYMYIPEFFYNRPWYPYLDQIKRATVEDGVSDIAKGVFYDCKNLKSVTIPESVTEINDWAFEGCSGLTSVTIPDSVTRIGYRAFFGCSSLTSVSIPSGVTEIGRDAYMIDSAYSFAECSRLTNITVASGNASYSSKNGVLFSKDKTALLCYPGGKSGAYTIPSSVTEVADGAFYGCAKLTSVTISSGVTSIGWEAFYGCTALTGVTIPSSVTYIGYSAFYGCTALTSVSIPSSVTSINGGAFVNCSSLTKITVASGNPNFSSKDGVLFDKYKTELLCYPGGKSGTYTIPSSVTGIGSCAFSCCTGLTSVTIPSSVTSIGGEAFSCCSSLTKITIPSSVTSIGARAFWKCSSLKSIVIPDSVTEIGAAVFYGCSSLKTASIGRGITSLDFSWGEFVGAFGFFDGCSSLTSVTIPTSVTRIDPMSFHGCDSLTDVYYRGTKTQWNSINIDDYGNDPLFSATMHYNA